MNRLRMLLRRAQPYQSPIIIIPPIGFAWPSDAPRPAAAPVISGNIANGGVPVTDFSTLYTVFNAAPSSGDQTILVNGIFNGSFTPGPRIFDQPLTIRSANPLSPAIFNGAYATNSGRAISINQGGGDGVQSGLTLADLIIRVTDAVDGNNVFRPMLRLGNNCDRVNVVRCLFQGSVGASGEGLGYGMQVLGGGSNIRVIDAAFEDMSQGVVFGACDNVDLLFLSMRRLNTDGIVTNGCVGLNIYFHLYSEIKCVSAGAHPDRWATDGASATRQTTDAIDFRCFHDGDVSQPTINYSDGTVRSRGRAQSFWIADSARPSQRIKIIEPEIWGAMDNAIALTCNNDQVMNDMVIRDAKVRNITDPVAGETPGSTSGIRIQGGFSNLSFQGTNIWRLVNIVNGATGYGTVPPLSLASDGTNAERIVARTAWLAQRQLALLDCGYAL